MDAVKCDDYVGFESLLVVWKNKDSMSSVFTEEVYLLYNYNPKTDEWLADLKAINKRSFELSHIAIRFLSRRRVNRLAAVIYGIQK